MLLSFRFKSQFSGTQLRIYFTENDFLSFSPWFIHCASAGQRVSLCEEFHNRIFTRLSRKIRDEKKDNCSCVSLAKNDISHLTINHKYWFPICLRGKSLFTNFFRYCTLGRRMTLDFFLFLRAALHFEIIANSIMNNWER